MHLLTAMILVLLLVFPGALWGQGPPLTSGRYIGDSPKGTDKPYSQDQQKKQQLRKQQQGSRIPGTGSPSGKPTLQSSPPSKPLRGAPVGTPGQ